MDVSTFPYRVDERTKTFLASLISVMDESNVDFASHAGGIQVQFLEKGAGSTTLDAPIRFIPGGVEMTFPMNAVAKSNKDALSWLRKYHNYIKTNRKNGDQLTAVPQRCFVTIQATTDGQLKYHFTYMAAFDDGSLAQDMPQTRLYTTESLFARQRASQRSEPRASKPSSDIAEWE